MSMIRNIGLALGLAVMAASAPSLAQDQANPDAERLAERPDAAAFAPGMTLEVGGLPLRLAASGGVGAARRAEHEGE